MGDRAKLQGGLGYLREPDEIYRLSFSTIRAEADLGRFSESEAEIAIRIIHACGMVDIAADLSFTSSFTASAIAALRAGKPIFCDAGMVAQGIIGKLLPVDNPVICTLRDPGVEQLAADLGTTRSAAAVELWKTQLAGAVVAIGNAPTALFHLLDYLDAGGVRPAAIIGLPVGFVGAAESKEALAARPHLASLVLNGRRGGSAMAAAAVNALARLSTSA